MRALGGQLRGLVLFFVALGVGFVTWMGLSTMLGETQRIKGVCLAVGAVFASLSDILWRRVDGRSLNWDVLTGRRYGAFVSRMGLPFWMAGLIGAVSGAVLAFSEPE